VSRVPLENNRKIEVRENRLAMAEIVEGAGISRATFYRIREKIEKGKKCSAANYNGRVERSNRIVREEFHSRKDLQANSLEEFREELARYICRYNNCRLHSRLDFKTPREYYLSLNRVGCICPTGCGPVQRPYTD
jgi:hypothetical protein